MNSLLTDSRASQLHLPDIVGQGYGTFWRFKGRYRVCKGSRASKKSKTTALWYIVNLMKYPQANLLVIRKVYRTLHDSCFTDLKWAISRLGVQAFWDVKESPLELTYKPTGQKILFRGLDDPLKVTSIAAEHGYLCWAWIEEAYEISSEADFNMIDESIRGAIPPETGLFKQVTLTFNPWNEHHWLKARFFDTPDPDTLALTTNYTCNEWLDDADRRVFERMKVQNPRRYSVAGLGEWGIVDGLVFENWVEEAFEKTIIAARPDVKSAFGLDFGYTNDPTAFFCGLVSEKEMTIWVFDELYERGLTNRAIYQRIYGMGYAKERIRGDSAEPKSLDELREEGLRRIRPAGKGPDSIRSGIQYIQNFRIVVHPRCVNFLTEISNYTWAKDKFGNKTGRPIDDFNHLMDAMRYAMEDMRAATVGKYALFAGGYGRSIFGYSVMSSVDAYNTSLTKSTPTELSCERCGHAAASVGGYALFAGGASSYNLLGYYDGLVGSVDAYNASLTRSAAHIFGDTAAIGGAAVGNYALFAGGTWDMQINEDLRQQI